MRRTGGLYEPFFLILNLVASPPVQDGRVGIKGVPGALVLLCVVVALVPVHVFTDADTDDDEADKDEGEHHP